MPSRNVTKEKVADSYYHVYARGINRQKLFIDNADYQHFICLFERYLSEKPSISSVKVVYPNFSKKIDLVTYCLMPNHFHLLIYQYEIPFLEKFMRSIMNSYSRYFNLKYRRTGSVFESRYKAIFIHKEMYLEHVSRYIHLNPRRWSNYRHSSLKYYMERNEPYWLKTNRILAHFNSRQDYCDFVSDYEEMRDSLCEIKDIITGK